MELGGVEVVVTTAPVPETVLVPLDGVAEVVVTTALPETVVVPLGGVAETMVVPNAGPRGDQGEPGVERETIPFSHGGELQTHVGTSRFPVVGGPFVIETVAASLTKEPTGAAVVLDVNVNDVSIYSDQNERPSIPEGARFGVGGTSDTNLTVGQGDLLSVDIDAVGSTTPGSDLVVSLRLRKV